MTLQEIYNTSKAHLLKQGVKAEGQFHPRKPPIPVYRLPNGLKCAIGCHIPDELYDPKMEKKGIIRLIKDFPDQMKSVFGEDVAGFMTSGVGLTTDKNKWTFLEKLQWIHDSDCVDPKEWKNELTKLALSFNLES